MSAGKLKRRMAIYYEGRTDDGAGGFTTAEVLWNEVWAEFVPLSQNERIEAMANNLAIDGRVRVRWRADLPIPVTIDYGGRYLESVGPWVDESDARTFAVYDVRMIQNWTPPT